MRTTTLKITTDLERLEKCSAMERPIRREFLGREVTVFLPPLSREQMRSRYLHDLPLCDSAFFWEGVDAVHYITGHRLAFCQHMVDAE